MLTELTVSKPWQDPEDGDKVGQLITLCPCFCNIIVRRRNLKSVP